jgi:AraC-like DNA-binding protein
MPYREFSAPRSVASHVACLWVSTGVTAGRVLPDGCVDLVWTGRRLVVAGPSTRPFASDATSSASRVGLRLRIGAAGVVLRYPMGELRDVSPELVDVWPAASALAERVAGAGSAQCQLQMLTAAVDRRLTDTDGIDPAVRAAVVALARPWTRVADARVALSERQLRRRFVTEVGYAPRTLARVLRLQRLLHLARDVRGSAGTVLATLAVTAGYADQSHMGRETARLTGLTPASLLAAPATAASEPGLLGHSMSIPSSDRAIHAGL